MMNQAGKSCFMSDPDCPMERIDMALLPLSYPIHEDADPLSACVACMASLSVGQPEPSRRRRRSSPLFMLMLALVAVVPAADPRFAHVFGDHMVLQRDRPVPVWGWSDPGAAITVSMGAVTQRAIAGADGVWRITLPAMGLGGAQELRVVADGGGTAVLRDVLMGDVWLCSGQSNSVFSLGGCRTPEDIAAADLPGIRFSGYWEHFAAEPQADVCARLRWQAVSPRTAASCSAMGFHFARAVHRATQVPIGILTCGVGGTEIECWMPPAAIAGHPRNQRIAEAARSAVSRWEAALLAGMTTGKGPRPEPWPVDQPVGLAAAQAWMDRVRSVVRDADACPAFAAIGQWMTAVRAAALHRQPLPSPPDLQALGEWLRKVSVPASLRRVPIIPHPLADRHGVGGHGWFRTQSLYNGMLHPLIPFAIRGMLWYQGENGSGPEADAYLVRFQTMVAALRAEWRYDFPIYAVQLANYGPPVERPDGGDLGWAITRMAQLQCLQVPKSGMAVAIDIGDAQDIHPRNKRDVGERLALWALARDYGRPVVCSGPLYQGMDIEPGRIRIRFSETAGGLMAGRKDGAGPVVEDRDGKLARFAIAGADRRWVWADAVIDGATVVVSHPQVSTPVAVRYAFARNPAGCNLYNRAGLPASPFRTDDW